MESSFTGKIRRSLSIRMADIVDIEDRIFITNVCSYSKSIIKTS